jgi:probable addiction module antidote protein
VIEVWQTVTFQKWHRGLKGQIAAQNIAICKAGRRGMSNVAKEAGVKREALYRALSEKGDPRLSTLLGVLKALNISLQVAKPQDNAAA